MKVLNDIKLLDSMLLDFDKVNELYKPVWFWEEAGSRITNEIKKHKYIEFGDVRRSYFSSDIDYYLQYKYCSKHLDFDKIKIVVELGSGSGKQVEIIKKENPKICFLLFDIPPQLYICEQYLKNVFGDCIIGYETSKRLNELPSKHEGKIFILPAFKFPMIENIEVDLFWNSSSFQEMHIDCVSNYLNYVNKSAKYVFLNEVMQGKKPRDIVYNKITLQDYINFLINFDLLDLSPSWSIEHNYFDDFCNLFKPYSNYLYKWLIMRKKGNSCSLWKSKLDAI